MNLRGARNPGMGEVGGECAPLGLAGGGDVVALPGRRDALAGWCPAGTRSLQSVVPDWAFKRVVRAAGESARDGTGARAEIATDGHPEVFATDQGGDGFANETATVPALGRWGGSRRRRTRGVDRRKGGNTRVRGPRVRAGLGREVRKMGGGGPRRGRVERSEGCRDRGWVVLSRSRWRRGRGGPGA